MTALLVAILGVFVLLSVSRPAEPRRRLDLVAESLWTLDTICRSLDTLLDEWPELREVRIDLAALPLLDEASALSVERALRTAAMTGVRLQLDGYDERMLHLLMRRGIRPQHFGNRRLRP